jgi:heptaprenyl diphosphate synthase
VPTLPVLYVRAYAQPADERLLELLDTDLEDDALIEEALWRLRSHQGVECARSELRRYAQECERCLMGLPEIPARAGLRMLYEIIVARTLGSRRSTY